MAINYYKSLGQGRHKTTRKPYFNCGPSSKANSEKVKGVYVR